MFWKRKKTANKQGDTPKASWKVLNELAQLDQIGQDSASRPQLIFKHSTRCGISAMVWRGFERNWESEGYAADLFVLDLLSYRNISDEIATRFQVFHQSPQLLIIKNGVVVAHESHGAIQEVPLSQYL
jgi:bacillithiol system protein YtxJ